MSGRMSYEDGAVIFRQGEAAGPAWVVQSGTVRLIKDGLQLADLGQGATLGGTGHSWTFTVLAHGHVVLAHRDGGAEPVDAEFEPAPPDLPSAKGGALVPVEVPPEPLWRRLPAILRSALPSEADAFLEFQPDMVEIEQRPAPKAAQWTLLAVVAMIVFAVTWASLAEIDRIVTAEGRLVTTSAKVVVQPLETGMIRSIRVRVGQTVAKGEVLATLDATFAEADTAASRAQLKSLDAQVKRLEAELAGARPDRYSDDAKEDSQQKDIRARRDAERKAALASYDSEIAESSAAIATLKREVADAEHTARIAREVEQMRLTLVQRDAGSRLQVLEAEARRTAAERDVNHLSNQSREIGQKLATVREKRGSYESEFNSKTAQELQTTRRERDKVAEDLKKQERRSSLVQMTSPEDAVVLEIAPRAAGSMASATEPLITLVPRDAPLEAELDVKPQDVAMLRPGDFTRLKLESLPYQQHGTLAGRLDIIGGDTIKVDKGGMTGPQQMYRARIAITDQTLRKIPADFHLIPGMTVSGEIKIGSRRVISYFIYPIFRALDESFREP
ncbi:MAG: HlyD family type I secretion periplasmic adaptor subunit [Magnetospirillum sp.]|nr:HlyD family type I secretion periplasmic adaptor subunit [Magnetospirillum sp.]